MSFLDVWILYAVFGTTAFSAVFVWAVRARQFTGFDHARYIALRSAKPVEEEQDDRKPGRIDRYTWAGLVLIAAAVLIAAVWIGVRSGGG